MLKSNFSPIKLNSDNPIIAFNLSGKVASYYHDNVWDFRAYIKNKNVCKSRAIIDFDIVLTDGSNLLEGQNKSFLLGVKEFLYVRNNIAHPKSGKILSPLSLISKYYSAITLINYLIGANKRNFSLISQLDITPFIAFVKSRNPKLASNSLTKYLSVIEDLHHYRDQLSCGINKHPWPNSSVIHLSGDHKYNELRAKRQTPQIPDDICVALFRQSINYLKENSQRIVNAHTNIERKIEEAMWPLLKSGKKATNINSDRIDVHAYYLAARTYSCKKNSSNELKAHGFNNKRELMRALRIARTCCYVILALTTGMRNSELSSLTNQSFYSNKGWDDEEYYWLKGLTYKLEDDPKPAKWMIPEIAEIAIGYLTTIGLVSNIAIARSLPYLNEEDRLKQGELLNHLFISKDTKTNFFNCISNAAWNKDLKLLAKHFNLELFNHTNDLNLPTGTIWPLASHHFRRTFACLAARSALGDMRYLREHYKHWSLDMTLYYSNHKDFDDTLFDEVLTERNELQAALVSDWLRTDEPLMGGRGESIATFRQRGSLKTASNLSHLSKQISDGVFVRGTGHSWCLASGDGCGGEGLYDAMKCSDCDKAVIDKNNVPVWEGLKQQYEEVLALNDSGIGSREKAKQYIERSNKIISKLG